MCVEARAQPWVLFLRSFHATFWGRVSLWPWAHQLGPTGFLGTGLSMCAQLVPGWWRVTSGSHACMANILPTESLPWLILCNLEAVYNKPIRFTLTLSARLLKSPIRLMVLRIGSVESSIMLWVVTGGKDCLWGNRVKKMSVVRSINKCDSLLQKAIDISCTLSVFSPLRWRWFWWLSFVYCRGRERVPELSSQTVNRNLPFPSAPLQLLYERPGFHNCFWIFLEYAGTLGSSSKMNLIHCNCLANHIINRMPMHV